MNSVVSSSDNTFQIILDYCFQSSSNYSEQISVFFCIIFMYVCVYIYIYMLYHVYVYMYLCSMYEVKLKIQSVNLGKK